MKKSKVKAIAYVKKGPVQRSPWDSVEEQRRRIEGFCLVKDFELCKVFVDEGKKCKN
ncbi:hypothetical protein [Aneurinibacillus tyrosinisolvens]|uniref:hypothetical protein n=1 Tax=Aneurinibacillus tyrosinisolvens TaxID=1443435 RepID=UPI000AA51A6E|nr:hypothetical protein [Aneurinibacillus tyrosinisolvens]